jgi:hypothetical protein
MIYKDYFPLLSIAMLILTVPAASPAADPDPLFGDDRMLDVRLSAPFEQLMQERSDEDELAGTFIMTTGEDARIEFDVDIRTRGNFRRKSNICRFAPLRINFRKSQVQGTLFTGQDKLKLVTHCNDSSYSYQQAVIKEYLAYRILNLLTDFSYRVRLLRITYVFADDDNEEAIGYAFFIENDDRMGKRIGLQQQKVSAVELGSLQPDYTNLTSVFQYLIGNLDFSPLQGAEGEDCCHNHAVFGDKHGTFWSIPYDFDMSGLVNAKYNAPNVRLGQLTTRQRIYRGRCVNNDKLPATLQLFLQRRSAIESVLAGQPELDGGTLRSLNSYIKSFYKKIDDDQAASRLSKECI